MRRFGTVIALVALFGAAAALLGCGPAPSGASAVNEYFEALAGGVDDRGWSMLHPEIRHDVFADDLQAYVSEAAATDWSDFRWRLTFSERHDPLVEVVHVEVLAGDEFPAFLRDDRDLGGRHFSLVSEAGTRGTIQVRLGPDGSGIWAYGD